MDRFLLPNLGPAVRMSLWLGVIALLAAILPHSPEGLSVLGLGVPLLGGMILDERTEFADATALNTGAAGKYLVGDVIDLSVARDIGNGETVYLVIQVTTAVTSAGAATVAFILASDAQAAIATDGTATEHIRTAAIAKATLVAGYTIVHPIPPESPAYERYLGLLQETGVAALTAGAVNAFLTLDPPKWAAYADAI